MEFSILENVYLLLAHTVDHDDIKAIEIDFQQKIEKSKTPIHIYYIKKDAYIFIHRNNYGTEIIVEDYLEKQLNDEEKEVVKIYLRHIRYVLNKN